MDTENTSTQTPSSDEIASIIARARRERSDYIVAALRSLVRHLRLPRKVPAPDRALPC